MNKDIIARFHRETAQCWRSKSQPVLADAHDARATAVDGGADLTANEQAGREYGVMADIADQVIAT